MMKDKETYTMQLTKDQVKWLLNRDNTNHALKSESDFRQQIEIQNYDMQGIVEYIVQLTGYRELAPEDKENSFLLSFKRGGSWVDEWINKDKLLLELSSWASENNIK